MAWFDREMHATLRVALVVVGILVATWIYTGRVPKVSPDVAVAVKTAARAAHDAQAAVSLARSIQSGAAPLVARPAVSIVHDVVPALSGAEIAAILHAAGNQKTQTVYRVHDTVSAPTPPPMPQANPRGFGDVQLQQIEAADEVAVARELAQTKIQTQVTVAQEPLPPSRISTVVTSDGAAGGLYALRRRGQLDFDIGVAKGSNYEALFSAQYRIKGTSLGVGPYVSFGGRRVGAGLAFSIQI